MEGDGEDDDPVEHEVDVFLTQALADKLFLLQDESRLGWRWSQHCQEGSQEKLELLKSGLKDNRTKRYPLRPVHMPYSTALMKEVKVKTGQQQVSMEVSVQPSGDNYSDSRGENIADMVERGRPTGGGANGLYYPSGYMDRMTLRGSAAVPSGSVGRYTLGVLRAGELHLTPLRGVVQVRPSFEYLAHKAAGERQTRLASARSDTESSEEEEAKPMTVRFARHGNKPEMDPSPSPCEEEWVPLHPVAFEDGEADTVRQLLFFQGDAELGFFTASCRAYLNAVLPMTGGQGVELPSSLEPMAGLRSLPVSDAVKALMVNVCVLPFSRVCSLLGAHGAAAEHNVLEELQRVCVLVQGCWVVRSEVLYPKDYASPHHSVGSDVMCRARDLTLLHFTSSVVVTRKELVGGVKVPSDELLDILRGLARRLPGTGWEFKCKHDAEFLLGHLEIVAKQLEWWRGRQESLAASMAEVSSRAEEGEPSRTKRGARRKTRVNTIGGRQVKVEAEEAVDQHLPVKMEPLTDPPPEGDGQATTPMDALKDLHKEQSSSPSAHPLRQVAVSEEALLQGLAAAGATEVDSKWMPSGGTKQRFFVMTQVGDETDEHRPHLLELLKQSKGVRKKQLCDEIERATGRPPNPKLLTVLLRDLCYSRGAYWYLNGT